MPTIPIARSYLFVPGHRPDRFDKACTAGADAVIIDLEDAVSPDDKAAAREAVSGWLSPDKPVLLRVNGADSEWFAADLALCHRPGVAGIVLPKAERVADIQQLSAGGDRPVLPLIETALGFHQAEALARTPGVQRLLFGTIDFQVDLGSSANEEELRYFRWQLVLVSRLAGIQPPVDGVSTAINDTEQLRHDTLRGKRLGFGGKLCIHPRQVATVNSCFIPTDAEVAWARRIVAAAEGAKGAAVAVDGKMVDKPVILQAERILAGVRDQETH